MLITDAVQHLNPSAQLVHDASADTLSITQGNSPNTYTLTIERGRQLVEVIQFQNLATLTLYLTIRGQFDGWRVEPVVRVRPAAPAPISMLKANERPIGRSGKR